MESMVFKDYMIKDDRQFSRFLMEKVNLLDTSQVNSNSILSSLNELYRNDYEKQKYFLQDYYCTYLDSMKPNILMEYYLMQGDIEELETLMQMERERGSKDMQTWITIYQILLKNQKGELSGTDLIDEIFKVKNTNSESLIFSLIVHLYGIQETGLFEPFHKVLKVVAPMVELMENEYLREAYRIRLMEMEAMTYLYMNEIEQCRAKCLQVIKRNELQFYFPIVYANFFHILGQSYMFENFEVAKYWVEQARDALLRLSGNRAADRTQYTVNTIDFLHSFWGIDIHTEPADEAEKAHRLIVLGRVNEAVDILDSLKRTRGYLTSYQLFYYGLATNDDSILSVARDVFTSNSNYFYLQLLDTENLHKYKNQIRRMNQ